MKKLKEKRGITLIALVITIIVLLILAGVTIATLTGDNGLLQRATTAKQDNEEATALEKIKLEVAGSYALDGKVDLSQLKTNLKRLDIPDEDIIPTIKDEKETFPVAVKIDNYEYDILEDATVYKHVDFATLKSLYGTVVNGYNAGNNLDETKKVDSWQLLYVDEKNKDAILISSNLLPAPQPTENGIPLVSKSGVAYTGSNNVASFEYGKNYNGLWLEKCTTESQYKNAKATAYMCDPDNWREYVEGKAKYAAGGATREIMVASFYNIQVNDFKNEEYNGEGAGIRNIDKYGYLEMPEGFNVTGFYKTNNDTWIASPTYFYAYRDGSMTYLNGSTGGFEQFLYNSKFYSRPIVCLPVYAIEVVGEGENAVLNYK